MEYSPRHFQQAAGLVCYYNASKFHYLFVSCGEQNQRFVQVMSALPDQPQSDAFTAPIPIPEGRLLLRVDVDHANLCFAFRVIGHHDDWQEVPGLFDASILSDEASPPGLPNFTGAFVGMACQDVAGTGQPADFDWFEYCE